MNLLEVLAVPRLPLKNRRHARPRQQLRRRHKVSAQKTRGERNEHLGIGWEIKVRVGLAPNRKTPRGRSTTKQKQRFLPAMCSTSGCMTCWKTCQRAGKRGRMCCLR